MERLFVYFAGHGVIRGRAEEYWLLTGAGEGIDTEAVNVAKSVSEAFECGIPHVAFFADVEIDEFYAAQFGDPAYEVVQEAEGIFSRYLLRALRGEEAAALEEIVGGREPLAVLARGLKPVLGRNVRIAAGKLDRRQRPWCRPGSYWEPNVLAWIHPADPPAAEPPPSPRWDDVRLGEPSAEAADRGGSPPEPAAPPGDPDATDAGADDLDASDAAAVDELSQLYRQSEGRDHFETGIGLTVVGTVTDTAMLGDGETSLFEEDDAWHLRGHQGEPEGALVRLDVEEWAGAALLPGYVGVLTVTPTGSETTLAAKSVDHLAYVPQPSLGASVPADQVVSLVADLTARLQVGSFDADQLDPAVEEALQGDLNPSLAVLVAGEWARDGHRRKVRELLAAFERADRPVPFDLTVLAGRDWTR